VASGYYSDTIQGPRPRTTESVDGILWAAILQLLERSVSRNTLAEDFPEPCPDGLGETYATDRNAVLETIQAEIPDLPWPMSNRDLPPTLAVLDLIQFMHRHASKATPGSHHKFYDHHHLKFDRDKGQAEFRADANRLLARAGMAYALDDRGIITRLAPPVVRDQLRYQLPVTDDAEFDDLLERAIAKYLDPDPRVRREAVEKIWDAFERAKTIRSGRDKKAQATALIDAAANSSEEAALLDAEMRELTRIGNEFRIRHHEVNRIEPSDELIDYLFTRMYVLIYRLHAALR
jgi:hypothetical protein